MAILGCILNHVNFPLRSSWPTWYSWAAWYAWPQRQRGLPVGKTQPE